MRIGCVPFWQHLHFQRCGWAIGKLLGSFKLCHMDDCSYMVNCSFLLPGSGAAKWVFPGTWLGRVNYKQKEPENEQGCTLGKGKSWGAQNSDSQLQQGWEIRSTDEDPIRRGINREPDTTQKHVEQARTLSWIGMGCPRVAFFWELAVWCISRFLWDKGTGSWARTIPWLTCKLAAYDQWQIMQELLILSSPLLSPH